MRTLPFVGCCLLLLLPASIVAPTCYGTPGVTVDRRVAASTDDAEEGASGSVEVASSDLELVDEPWNGNQTVGLRFAAIPVPPGATITHAHLEFTVDEPSIGPAALMIRGAAADNANAFTSSSGNVSGRPPTVAAAAWAPPDWPTVGASGSDQRTPELRTLIQEIVDRPGWSAGNALALTITGSGVRTAASWDGDPAGAPLLRITYKGGNATGCGGGSDDNWQLVFEDEFDAPALDEATWHTCFWWATDTCTIESNNELELYNAEDVLVENGLLRLRAQQRSMVGWNGETFDYTSGMVSTGGRKYEKPPGFTFTYGFAEARVKVPAGQGLWPAFWMLPVSYESRPEIDIMEILGHTPAIQRMHYHYIETGGSDGSAGANWTGPDFSAGWHTFAVHWTPEAIRWYVDDIERWAYTDAATISAEPSYLLLNLAVGGSWPGPPDPSTTFPSYYEIDHVRVWQTTGPVCSPTPN